MEQGQLNGVVWLEQEQYDGLKANGSITIDGVTHTYDEDVLYITPTESGGGSGSLYEHRVTLYHSSNTTLEMVFSFINNTPTKYETLANLLVDYEKTFGVSASQAGYIDYQPCSGYYKDSSGDMYTVMGIKLIEVSDTSRFTLHAYKISDGRIV